MNFIKKIINFIKNKSKIFRSTTQRCGNYKPRIKNKPYGGKYGHKTYNSRNYDLL